MPLHGIEDAPLDRRQAQTFRQDGLTAAWADRPSGSLSWEIGCTPGGDGASLGMGEDAEGMLVAIKGFNSSLTASQQRGNVEPTAVDDLHRVSWGSSFTTSQRARRESRVESACRSIGRRLPRFWTTHSPPPHFE